MLSVVFVLVLIFYSTACCYWRSGLSLRARHAGPLLRYFLVDEEASAGLRCLFLAHAFIFRYLFLVGPFGQFIFCRHSSCPVRSDRKGRASLHS